MSTGEATEHGAVGWLSGVYYVALPFQADATRISVAFDIMPTASL
jgi:hypothetical protein